jgi:crotonobetainyl-CoA:carnitine CoA-transferase CaiB-like acyl-CoA transferase
MIELVGSPFHIGGINPSSPVTPPALGQHTEEVLAQLLGLDPARLQELRAQGVI